MQLLLAFATLIASISAAAIPNTLSQRATCPPASGPFTLMVSGGGDLTGRYAHAGAPDTLPFVIFGVKPNKDGSAPGRATEFKLDSSGHLISVQNGKNYIAYNNEPGDNTGHITITTNTNIANKIICEISGGTCALSCSVAGYSSNYLASPKFQPDWRIASSQAVNHPGNIAFSPIAVAVPS